MLLSSLLVMQFFSIAVAEGLLLSTLHLPASKASSPFLLASSTSKTESVNQQNSISIAALDDGNYQFCSRVDPGKWLDGDGVCFIFQKIGKQIEGYYGYPHSDNFICFKGTAQDNLLNGQAFVISWEGAEWRSVPQTAFKWDTEGHLTLNQAVRLPLEGAHDEATSKILFRDARLDLHSFYHYQQPRMKSPSELCSWTKQ